MRAPCPGAPNHSQISRSDAKSPKTSHDRSIADSLERSCVGRATADIRRNPNYEDRHHYPENNHYKEKREYRENKANIDNKNGNDNHKDQDKDRDI